MRLYTTDLQKKALQIFYDRESPKLYKADYWLADSVNASILACQVLKARVVALECFLWKNMVNA